MTDALEEAIRDLARAVGEASEPRQPTARRAEDGSRNSGRPERRDAPEAAGNEPRGARSLHSSRIRRLPSVLHGSSIRTLLIAAVLCTVVIVVGVSHLASPVRSTNDVVTQSCAVRDSGVQATVVVTNHGGGTASYTFDVVFSQNQAAVEGVPTRVTALRSGTSATVHAYSSALDTSRAFACTIANLHRSAGTGG